MERMEEQIEQAANLVVESQRIIVFTGAGVSTESGIPDFRSPGGIWSRYDPDDFTIQKFLSDKEARKRHWDLLMGGELLITRAEPNPAHYAIPDAVFFGESLLFEVLMESERRARSCDACFVIASSRVFHPALIMPM